jgi:hypothetical protein
MPTSVSAEAQHPASSELLLEDIRVVLVAPKLAANIGATARACANFEVMARGARACGDGGGGGNNTHTTPPHKHLTHTHKTAKGARPLHRGAAV